MNFSEDTFSEILHLCQNNPNDTNLLNSLLNEMSKFQIAYDNSKGKTRGTKRTCIADNCFKSFYDFERNTKYCVEHSLTPYSPKFIKLNKKIKDLIRISLREEIFKNDIWNKKNLLRWLRYYRDDRENAIQLKKCNNEIIKLISLEIEPIINKDIVLCTVPSSTQGKIDTGINRLAKLLIAENRIDGIDCLIRFKSRPKNSYGGDRDLQGQLNTLKLNNQNKIKNRTILLLDDVRKTGNSLEACSQILLKNGAIDVYKLVIWKAGILND